MNSRLLGLCFALKPPPLTNLVQLPCRSSSSTKQPLKVPSSSDYVKYLKNSTEIKLQTFHQSDNRVSYVNLNRDPEGGYFVKMHEKRGSGKKSKIYFGVGKDSSAMIDSLEKAKVEINRVRTSRVLAMFTSTKFPSTHIEVKLIKDNNANKWEDDDDSEAGLDAMIRIKWYEYNLGRSFFVFFDFARADDLKLCLKDFHDIVKKTRENSFS